MYGIVLALYSCFFQAEDGIRDLVRSRGLGDVYKRQPEALGKGLANISDPEVSETIELLMRLNNDLATALLEDETIAPIIYPLDESCEEYDYAAWALSLIHISEPTRPY